MEKILTIDPMVYLPLYFFFLPESFRSQYFFQEFFPRIHRWNHQKSLRFDPHLISVEFEMDPTWTSVFEIQAQLKTTDGEYLDACFGGRHPAIDFVAMECSKPRRASNYLVVHAKPDFSKNHLDASTNDILFRIKHEFEKVFNIKAKPVLSHRWRFARPKYPGKTSQKGVYKLAPNLWLAGDYLAGGRVEGAYLSGLEAAARLRCCL